MRHATRMFVLGVAAGAALTGGTMFYACASAAAGPKMPKGIEWSGSQEGARIKVTGKNQTFFLVGRRRQGGDEKLRMDVQPGTVLFHGKDYEEVSIFRGSLEAVFPAGADRPRICDCPTCAPCIVNPPPPPPTGAWGFDLVAVSPDFALSFEPGELKRPQLPPGPG